MAGELIWSRSALDDIEAIAAFIARDSSTHACKIVERIFLTSEQLLSRGGQRMLAPEGDQDQIFEQRLQGFRILYEHQGQDLHLLAVVHGHQLASHPTKRF